MTPTWREKRASLDAIDPIKAALDAWFNDTPPRTLRDRMADAIECHAVADLRRRVCDEPRCTDEATCGVLLPDGGYRRTCGRHGQ